ncbi:hypothetical protein HMPREF9151_02168 [Hoylesella saccharolytica F0055]|uniref:Uncharacterized protein n=1 Tax=Hoylesella saccharolytica F0055 TaxID=1127699 RepID=L1N1L6_9BACT|nr:hypothetical protein HMPREF9151_02168 [Hoylesella saccharolytica F0055]
MPHVNINSVYICKTNIFSVNKNTFDCFSFEKVTNLRKIVFICYKNLHTYATISPYFYINNTFNKHRKSRLCTFNFQKLCFQPSKA